MYSHRLYGSTVRAPALLSAPFSSSAAADITISEAASPFAPHSAGALISDGFAYEQMSDGGVRVTWQDLVQFDVSNDGSRIVARGGSTHAESVYSYLLSQALSVALLQRGVEALHAVAIEKGGVAIAFIGDCGYGKSTLGAYALRAGARLLTDDLLVCDGDVTPRVLPGAARIKLDPAIAARTLGTRNGTPMNDARGKWIYPLNPREFASEPVRLSRIYAIQPDSETFSIERLAGAAALRELIAATFNPLKQETQRLRRHLQFNAGLARAVPVFMLQMQKGLEFVPAALEALFDQP